MDYNLPYKSPFEWGKKPQNSPRNSDPSPPRKFTMTEKKPRLEVSPRHLNTRFGKAPAPIVSPTRKSPSPLIRELELSEIGLAPSVSNRSTISN
jgi:hypothetical protein